jgi:ferredoxin
MSSYRLIINNDRQQQLQKKEQISDETDLLATIQKLGLSIRQACRNGVCGLCRCRLVGGEITYHHRDPYALGEEDREAGFILPCIAFAVSDLEVELRSRDGSFQ